MELERIRRDLFRRYYPLLLDASAIVLEALSVSDMYAAGDPETLGVPRLTQKNRVGACHLCNL